MITKTQRNYRRKINTIRGQHDPCQERHSEVVLRETWWLLGFIPLYSRETIERTSL